MFLCCRPPSPTPFSCNALPPDALLQHQVMADLVVSLLGMSSYGSTSSAAARPLPTKGPYALFHFGWARMSPRLHGPSGIFFEIFAKYHDDASCSSTVVFGNAKNGKYLGKYLDARCIEQLLSPTTQVPLPSTLEDPVDVKFHVVTLNIYENVVRLLPWPKTRVQLPSPCMTTSTTNVPRTSTASTLHRTRTAPLECFEGITSRRRP